MIELNNETETTSTSIFIAPQKEQHKINNKQEKNEKEEIINRAYKHQLEYNIIFIFNWITTTKRFRKTQPTNIHSCYEMPFPRNSIRTKKENVETKPKENRIKKKSNRSNLSRNVAEHNAHTHTTHENRIQCMFGEEARPTPKA